MDSSKTIQKSITIHAPAAKVWAVLTTPELVKQWLTDMGTVEVKSDWKVGSPISFEGKWHTGIVYKDKGTILKFEPGKVFQYTYWNEISHFPDTPEYYVVIELSLQPEGNNTVLSVTLTNLINEAVYGHWNFYWQVTLHVIKRLVEKMV